MSRRKTLKTFVPIASKNSAPGQGKVFRCTVQRGFNTVIYLRKRILVPVPVHHGRFLQIASCTQVDRRLQSSVVDPDSLNPDPDTDPGL
jgi:hypothetical protein